MNDAQILLLAARTLIADPKCWTQNALARNGNGRMVRPSAPDAARFCASGAIEFVLDRDIPCRVVTRALNALSEATATLCPLGGYVVVNDTYTHAEVIRMFDRALELAA